MKRFVLLLGAALLLPACNEDKHAGREHRTDRQDARAERHRDHADHSRDRSDSRRDDADDRTDTSRHGDNRRSSDRDRSDGLRQSRTRSLESNSADVQFLKDATMANLTEVELGQVAIRQSSSDDVRRYGQRMVTDHRQNQAKLETLARNLGVELPTELDPTHRQMVDRHAALTGADFDRAYIEMMTQDHHTVVGKFERQSQEAGNEQVRNYASSTLPTLRDHLRDAQNLNETLASRQ